MARGEPLIRQWNLLKTLQAHRFGVGTDELAKRLEYSKRQIQRDLNLLQQVGFPISFEERDFGKRFWKLSPQFIESKELILSVTELLSLYLSQQLLTPLAGTQFGSGLATALDKIKALIPKKALGYFGDLDHTLLVKNSARHDYSRHDKEIRILNQAMAEGRVLNLRYQSAGKGRAYDTQFHPYGMVFFAASLYCIGYLAEYSEIRTLKIDRILGVEMTNSTFRRPITFSLQTYTQGSFGIIVSDELQTITVRFTGWAANEIREQTWHLSQKILEDSDGHLTAQFELSDSTEFTRWILGFGHHAAVLQPKSLADKIRQELQLATKQY
jgi:predicted DNA-binding transcriptional regulator YafY